MKATKRWTNDGTKFRPIRIRFTIDANDLAMAIHLVLMKDYYDEFDVDDFLTAEDTPAPATWGERLTKKEIEEKLRGTLHDDGKRALWYALDHVHLSYRNEGEDGLSPLDRYQEWLEATARYLYPSFF